MNKVQDFIRERGGTVHVARQLGIAPSSVSTWISRGAIPIKRWQRFIDRNVASWRQLSELHEPANTEVAA